MHTLSNFGCTRTQARHPAGCRPPPWPRGRSGTPTPSQTACACQSARTARSHAFRRPAGRRRCASTGTARSRCARPAASEAPRTGCHSRHVQRHSRHVQRGRAAARSRVHGRSPRPPVGALCPGASSVHACSWQNQKRYITALTQVYDDIVSSAWEDGASVLWTSGSNAPDTAVYPIFLCVEDDGNLRYCAKDERRHSPSLRPIVSRPLVP